MADAEYVVDFPTLFVALDWIEAHCIVPDGLRKGERFEPVDWQAWGFLNFYRLRLNAAVGQLATAFRYRRSQIVLPQKAGKAPYTASHICTEAVGPALFAGWAKGGERWDCRDYGCECGWLYEYQPGEAMGRPWPTPLIQITATSEDQTDNVYDALRPMIDDGPLAQLIPKTGEEFIRLPNKGRIDVVTSNARSRLGQRVTFCPQDETGLWTRETGMIKVAETQRRGLAGMGGRAEETTNAWDPSEGSVAQRTAEAALEDIFRLHPIPPRSLSYRNKAERRRIHRLVYKGCDWIDLDAIEAEAAELIDLDPGQAERFFGNRPVTGEDTAFDPYVWDGLAASYQPKAGARVVIGVDGARFEDALAVVATDVKSAHQFVLGIWERPEAAPDEYEHPFGDVDQVVIEAFERFSIWRVYIDPQYIETLVDRWQARWGDKVIVPWRTNRPTPIAWAVRNFTQAVGAGDLSHDGAAQLARHVENAKRAPLNVYDDKHRRMWTLAKEHPHSRRKIDGAMAAILSWEARGDCIAAGEAEPPRKRSRVPVSH